MLVPDGPEGSAWPHPFIRPTAWWQRPAPRVLTTDLHAHHTNDQGLMCQKQMPEAHHAIKRMWSDMNRCKQGAECQSGRDQVLTALIMR